MPDEFCCNSARYTKDCSDGPIHSAGCGRQEVRVVDVQLPEVPRCLITEDDYRRVPGVISARTTGPGRVALLVEAGATEAVREIVEEATRVNLVVDIREAREWWLCPECEQGWSKAPEGDHDRQMSHMVEDWATCQGQPVKVREVGGNDG